MTANKALLSGVSFLQIIVLPLLILKLSRNDWTWQLGCALVMALALSLIRTQWQLKGLIIIAALFGGFACVGQWQLLPLVLAQLALTVVISTQELSICWKASGWVVIVLFMQLLITYSIVHTLVPTLIVLFILTALPVVVAIWADRLPFAAVVILLVAIAAGGYWLQQFTLIAAAAVLIIGTITSSRFVQPRLSWYATGGLGFEVIYLLTRLHG